MYRLGYTGRDLDGDEDDIWRELNARPMIRAQINRRMARATGLPLRVFDGSAKRDSTEDWQTDWREMEQQESET